MGIKQSSTYDRVLDKSYDKSYGEILYDEKTSFKIDDRISVKYAGDLVNGKPHGTGQLTFSKDTIYNGEFANGKINGTGIINYGKDIFEKDCIIEGIWKDNKLINGKGRYAFPEGDIYDGDWLNNAPHGQGWQYMGVDHKGESCIIGGIWKDNKCISGKGRYKYGDGIIYDGDWINGKKSGQGTLYFPDGRIVSGHFIGDITTSVAEEIPGKYKYQGEFKTYIKHGSGVMIMDNGTEYRGIWKNGKMDGMFTILNKEPSLLLGVKAMGVMQNDKQIGMWAIELSDGTVIYQMWEDGVPKAIHEFALKK